MFEEEGKRFASTLELFYKKGVMDGYSKAEKEIGVIWHDLRKNPDDLPPVGIGVIISGYLGDMKGLHGLDEWDGEKWTNTDMPGLVREAWCEVPKFEGGK